MDEDGDGEGDTEDVGEVIATGGAIEAAGSAWTDCVRTAATSHLDPAFNEEKVYCAGVGNVYVLEPGTEVWLEGTTGLKVAIFVRKVEARHVGADLRSTSRRCRSLGEPGPPSATAPTCFQCWRDVLTAPARGESPSGRR